MWNIEILATDIDKKTLVSAKIGVYRQNSFKNTEKKYIESYFKKIDGRFKVSDRVKNMVSFDYFNLAETPVPAGLKGKWDVVFCRNVLIYFTPDIREKIIKNLCKNIRQNGYLFIGYSEVLTTHAGGFSPVKFNEVFVYKKTAKKADTIEEVAGGFTCKLLVELCKRKIQYLQKK